MKVSQQHNNSPTANQYVTVVSLLALEIPKEFFVRSIPHKVLIVVANVWEIWTSIR